MHTIPFMKSQKNENTLHTITCLKLFMSPFCATHIQNLLNRSVKGFIYLIYQQKNCTKIFFSFFLNKRSFVCQVKFFFCTFSNVFHSTENRFCDFCIHV